MSATARTAFGVLAFSACVALVPSMALAQAPLASDPVDRQQDADAAGVGGPQQEGDMPDTGQESEYATSEPQDYPRFFVGGFGGRLSGGTSVGFAENLFFRSTFEQGSDSLFGVRFGYAFAARFEAEAEWGTSSPGVDAVLTDLAGQNRTEVAFADMDFRYFTVSVLYSMLERDRRFVPFLQLGVGRVTVSSSEESGLDAGEIGILFGAGLRVNVIENFAIRADVRGLRSGLSSNDDVAGETPALFGGNFNASNLVWTVGGQFSF